LCRKYNLNTVIAYSGEQALEILPQRANVKLVLVDYMMPGMDGLQLTQEIRKKYKKDEVAIIALSGTSEKEIVASFLKYGANDFLYKDFSDEEFFARVNNNLEVVELFSTTQDKAKKDYMTGLFNKHYFLNESDSLINRARERNELICIFVIKIDEYNVICDSYGHDIGDEAVNLLATILTKYLNEDSIISRFGADQFGVVLKNRPYAELTQIFDELQDVVANTMLEVGDFKHNYTISIGATIELGESIEDMLESADQALYDAQQLGTSRYKIDS